MLSWCLFLKPEETTVSADTVNLSPLAYKHLIPAPENCRVKILLMLSVLCPSYPSAQLWVSSTALGIWYLHHYMDALWPTTALLYRMADPCSCSAHGVCSLLALFSDVSLCSLLHCPFKHRWGEFLLNILVLLQVSS